MLNPLKGLKGEKMSDNQDKNEANVQSDSFDKSNKKLNLVV
jgi:hypothetical protein